MFKLTQIVDSFSVIGGLLEHVFPGPNRQLIVYSNDRIRIYSVSISTLQLLHQIDLQTNILQIVFLRNLDANQDLQLPHAPLGRLAVLNDQCQLILLTPAPPFNHKILPLPQHFVNCPTMTTTQNKLALILRQDVGLVVYFQMQGKEHSTQFDLRAITNGQTIQVDCSFDGDLVILSQQYERPVMNEQPNTLNVQIGQYKTTIHQLKLMNLLKPSTMDQYRKANYNFLILQIHALKNEEVLALTNQSIFCQKKGSLEASLSIQFQQPIQPNSFMKVITERNHILISSAPIIQLIYYHQDPSDNSKSMSYLQPLQIIESTYGIVDLSICLFDTENHHSLIWMQTEICASYLGTVSEKAQLVPLNQAIEPEPQKKIKGAEYPSKEYQIKIQFYFPTLKRIYDFVKFPNHLFILAGGYYKQQLSRVNTGLQLLQNQTTATFKVNLQNYFHQNSVTRFHVTADGLIVVQLHDIQFHRIALSENTELQLQPFNYSIPEQDRLIAVHLYRGNVYVLHFESKIIATDLTETTVLNINATQIQACGTFLMVQDENKLLHFTAKWPFNELTPLSVVIPDSPDYGNFGLTQQETKVLILLQNQHALLIYSYQNSSFKQIFISNQFHGGPALIYNQQFLTIESKLPQVHYPITGLAAALKPLVEIPIQPVSSFVAVLGSNTLLVGLISTQFMIYRTHLKDSIHVLQRMLFSIPIPKVLNPRNPNYVQINANSIYLDQTGHAIMEYNGKLNCQQFQCVDSEASLSFVQMNKSSVIISCHQSNEIGVYVLGQADPLAIPGDNVQLTILPTNKSKTVLFMEPLTINTQCYLIVVAKINDPNLIIKNEIVLFKAEQAGFALAEYSEMEREEVFKLQAMACSDGTATIVVLSVQQQVQSCECRIRTIKFKPSSKQLILQDLKAVKDMVPTDMVFLRCFQQILISTGEQIKFFDPNSAKTSNLIVLHLQDNITKTPIQPINILQLAQCEYWIAILDNRFRIIIAKFLTLIQEPKIEWIIEFGVNQRQALVDVQIAKINERMTLVVIDAMHNVHIYSISQEKVNIRLIDYQSRVKKMADCNIYAPSRLRVFNDYFLISTAFGQMYQLQWENDKQEYPLFKLITEQLPYTGGYPPSNKFGAQKVNPNQSMNVKGLVLHQQYMNALEYLSVPIRETLLSRFSP